MTVKGEEVSVNVSQYRNTMDPFATLDDALTHLIHIGYLAYDQGGGDLK